MICEVRTTGTFNVYLRHPCRLLRLIVVISHGMLCAASPARCHHLY